MQRLTMPPAGATSSRRPALLLAAAIAACLHGAAAQEGASPPAAAPEAPADDTPSAKPKPKPPAPKPKQAEKPRSKSDATLLEPSGGNSQGVWPNGASSISETYGDWTMSCSRDTQQTDCVVIQSQGDKRSGRRQFSIELHPPREGRAEGLILMPFGLQIEPGVTFKLDDQALGKGAPYTYCVADGCLVAISLPTLATDTMKTAQTMTVSALKKDAKEPTQIVLPLAGFAAAFSRAAVLEQ